MKRAFALLLSVMLMATAIIPLGLIASAANKAPTVIPAIREWTGSSGSFTPNSSTVLVNKSNSPSISKVSGFFEEMLGLKLSTSATADGNNEIVFTKDTSLQGQVGKEGYTLTATTSKIEIKAPTDTGLLYGGITVVQSLTADGAFPCGSAVDYPEYEIRSGLIDVGRAWMPLDYVEEITRYMAYFKMNEIHVHINDDGKNYYSGFRLESDIKGLSSKDGYYTKDEYRAYQKKMLEYGVTVITEIDTPFHASCYANAENPPPYLPDNYRCLDIRPEKFDETVAFVKKLLAEYMTGDDPVFVNKVVHIGTDEYPREYSEDMRRYTDTLIDYVNSLGYTPRFWGALGPSGFQGTTPISENAQMNFWDWRISGVEETLNSNYDIINTLNEALYVVPTFGNYDRFNLKNLYNKWQVNYFNIDGTYQIDADDERLLGACFGMWNDWHTEYIGITRFDIFDRLRAMVCLLSEKTWLGLDTKNISADDFIARYEKLSLRAGDADPGRHSVPKEGLSVDFEGTLPEYVTLNGGKIENGAFVLDGNSYLSLTPDAIGFPNTLEFDIYLEEATTAPLFAGDGITISSNIDGKGNFGFKTEFYTFTYDYRLPTGVKTNIRLTSDINKATLIVNGRRYEPKNALNPTNTVLSTLTAPLSEIGKGVKGYIDNIKVMPKTAHENVALGAKATASSLEVNDGRFTADLAVDGDDTAASRLSFSRDADVQWLLLDLGTSYSISEFEISFNEHVPSYEIQVSEDGTTYTSVYKLTNGQNGGEATDKITLASAVDARYIKYVQLQRWEHASWGKYSGGIKEFRAFSFGETPDPAKDNLIYGKEFFGTHNRSEYYADLTDGKAYEALKWDNEAWFGLFYHPGLSNEDNISQKNTNAPNGIGTIGYDLGGVYALSQVRVNTFLGNNSGIAVPESIALEISLDGVNYREVMRNEFDEVDPNGANARLVDWVYFSFAAPESAKYIRLKFDLRAPATMAFINEIEVNGVPDASYEPEAPSSNNVALGKDYTGANASPAGNYSANLTDGVASTEEKYDSNWFGFYYNNGATADKINAPNGIGEVVIDLDEVVGGISDIRTHVWNCNASGILGAKGITAFVSEDGDTYTKLGELAIPDGDSPAWAILSVDNASARYVKLVVETQAVWTFLNEIEVLADPNYVPDDETSEPEISEPEVSEPEVSEPEVSEPETEDATNVALNKEVDVLAHATYNANLTDGVALQVMNYSSNNWFAFQNDSSNPEIFSNAPDRIGTAVIDLDGSFDIEGVKINAIRNEGSGIDLPAAVKVYLSDDGTNWGEATELNIPALEDTTKDVAFVIGGDVIGTASFVKVEFVLGEKAYVFLNEIEVYGEEAEDDGDVSEPEVSEPEVSEPEVSEPDVSEPDVSEPDVSEPDVSEPETGDTNNVALNKDFEATVHGNYTASLTDGVAYDKIAYDNNWFAFYNNGPTNSTNAPDKVGTVVINLDGSFDINGIKINAVQNVGSGIGMPAAINVYLSDDGETWGEAIALNVPAIEDTVTNEAFAIEGDVVGTASFVKVEFVLGEKSFVFFNEIEVYGEEAEDDGDVSEPEVSEPEVSEPEVSEPEVSEPEVSEPEVSEPEVSEPEVSEPEVSEPEVSDPDVSEPEVSEPETSEPEVSEPDVSEPGEGDGEGDGDGDGEKGKLGDVDFDGDVDAADYILVKRSVLKTYNLTDEQFDVADIDKDNDVDTADYVLVKRIVLGTYTVKQDN